MSVSAEMPKYRCHKEVWALQIDHVVLPDDSEKAGPAMIHFIDPAYAPVAAEAFMFARYMPARGDYYVVYPGDGYKSISPKAVFEDGYTPIKP